MIDRMQSIDATLSPPVGISNPPTKADHEDHARLREALDRQAPERGGRHASRQ